MFLAGTQRRLFLSLAGWIGVKWEREARGSDEVKGTELTELNHPSLGGAQRRGRNRDANKWKEEGEGCKGSVENSFIDELQNH
ncbi:hypothetical protein KY284_020486 [Solanum tuberosum]|nr:hypothetical protein KY284_020486 [Solanum tuberosum]